MTQDSNVLLSNKKNYSALINLLMQLRKVCQHPYLFEGAEPEFDGEYREGNHLIKNSGKLVVLDKLLHKLKEEGSQVLIFSQFVRMLDILEDYCKMKKWKFVRLDGSTHQIKRNLNINRFSEENSDIFIFLLSTKAGGLGINLTSANTVILYDSDWNPQTDLQAQSRVHRIGQTRKVSVYRFIAKDTVEERIIKRAEKKMYLDSMVVRKAELYGQENMDKLDESALMKMLTFGAQKIFTSGGTDLTDEDINSLMSRFQQPMNSGDSSIIEYQDGEHDTADFSISEDHPLYTFLGKDYTKEVNEARENSLSEFFSNTKNRKRKSSTSSKYKQRVTPPPQKKRKGRKYQIDTKCFICKKKKSEPTCTCAQCPRIYHLSCLGVTEMPRFPLFRCSWHYCAVCNSSSTQSGGLLFCCTNCPTAYCNTCIDLPSVKIVDGCDDLIELNYHRRSMIFIECNNCKED
eukprot:TRINITY_DN7335_c0_g1_i1.p1 TRINITY_DN7335_c0_g1~~TRINITY_DN7335_c0_g1_i1.p1  ORF type:complete len:513 (+),score=95.06 TRINITY_DN7335_c0_g1_i1:160-1539(+)